MNPDNYASLPACKKLAEVLAKKGMVLKTEAWWSYDIARGWYLTMMPSVHWERIEAPSMAEVWRELPDGARIWRLEGGSVVGFGSGKIPEIQPNPTDALIELWIWVLEQEGRPWVEIPDPASPDVIIQGKVQEDVSHVRVNRQVMEGRDMHWNQTVADFANRMTKRFMEKQSENWSGHDRIPECELRKRAINNIFVGDYVDAANLCLLADLAQGTERGI